MLSSGCLARGVLLLWFIWIVHSVIGIILSGELVLGMEHIHCIDIDILKTPKVMKLGYNCNTVNSGAQKSLPLKHSKTTWYCSRHLQA